MNGQSLNFNSNLNILKQCISVGLLKEHDFFVCVWLCRVRHKHLPARHGECKIVLASVNWDSLASLASVKYFPNIELSLRTLNSVWAPYKVKYIESLERVQKRATKTIPELKALCYEDRLKALKLPTLAYRRVRGDMIEAYKITNGIYDTEVVPNLKFRENVSLRGHSKTLRKDRVNKRIRANSFTQRIVNIWNSLPECIVGAPSVSAFKNRLDKFWENQEIKFNYKAPLSTGRKTRISQVELDIEVTSNLNPDTS